MTRNAMEGNVPEFTAGCFERGMACFRKKYWPKDPDGADFHAPLYRDLRGMHLSMFTQGWWRKIYATNESGNLTKWRATRTPAPGAQSKIDKAGASRLRKFLQAYKHIPDVVKKHGIASPSCKWEVVAPLFDIACEIKKNQNGSVVFADKLCHFILPKAFPVLDNDLSIILKISTPTREKYYRYWHECQERWRECAPQARLEMEDALRRKIERVYAGKGFVAYYPWAAKITELCSWGCGES